VSTMLCENETKQLFFFNIVITTDNCVNGRSDVTVPKFFIYGQFGRFQRKNCSFMFGFGSL